MNATLQPRRVQIAGLDAIEVVVPGASAGAFTGVILHGYGADMTDLAPLANVMDAPPGTRWIFPNGPLRIPMGPYWTGSAWFPIDVAALESAMSRGAHRDMAEVAPPELPAAREAVLGLIAALGVPLQRLVLGGFSQGAMLATDLALHLPITPAALLLWSGTLLQRELWQALAPKHAGLRFVQSHGRSDALLDYAAAERLHALLTGAGWRGRFVGFGGGHEIPDAAMDASRALLTEITGEFAASAGPTDATPTLVSEDP